MRRFKLAAGLAALVSLSACAGQSGPVTVRVNLQQAQAEATKIDADLGAVVAAAQSALTPAQVAQAAKAKAALDVAVAAFATVPSGTPTVQQLATEVVAAVQQVLDALPEISAQDKLAVDTGVAVIDAVIANLPLSMPAPAAT